MRNLSQAWSRLAISGRAERRERTTRRWMRKVMEDVVVRRISGNVRSISIEVFVNGPSIKNIPQC
jgi:hypothetical protein